MSDLISPEERAAIIQPAQHELSEAQTFAIVEARDYEAAGDRLKAIKGAQKLLEEKKRTLLNPVNATLKAIRDLFREPEETLVVAENLYKRAMIGYQQEQEDLRRAEQKKADEAAERERKRLEKEAREIEERAVAARQAGDIRKAEKLEKKADLKTDTAAAVVAPVIQREPPRVSGVATRENWYALVVDFKALVDAVAAGTVPLSALEPSMKVLNAQAKSLRKEFNWPGVRACRDNIMAAGSK
jgi:tetratricopeptide (TPR) repeat protein